FHSLQRPHRLHNLPRHPRRHAKQHNHLDPEHPLDLHRTLPANIRRTARGTTSIGLVSRYHASNAGRAAARSAAIFAASSSTPSAPIRLASLSLRNISPFPPCCTSP